MIVVMAVVVFMVVFRGCDLYDKADFCGDGDLCNIGGDQLV